MTTPMGRDDLMRQAGAVWCDTHARWECSKNSKRRASRCHAFAIRGTKACVNHSGVPVEVAKAKGEAAMSAWRAAPGQMTVAPAEAVMAMLQMSVLRAELYASLLERQFTKAQEDEDSGGFGDPELGDGRGLVGHTRGAAKDVGVYVSGEAARALTLLEGQERDRVVRYAKAAHDMGIADRQVKLAEQQGAMLAEVIRRTADALLAAVLALLPELTHRESVDAVVVERFARVVDAAVRAAWPGWLQTIVPREIAAVAGTEP
ncbi:hypothetical protein [Sphaerisporangium sp. NPDC051011]|uniref:hypothetical protein n=1 Tax=Sphaerisporangium sp. NPDC051011 TaxID=3155792 RepID=UPI0033CCF9E0